MEKNKKIDEKIKLDARYNEDYKTMIKIYKRDIPDEQKIILMNELTSPELTLELFVERFVEDDIGYPFIRSRLHGEDWDDCYDFLKGLDDVYFFIKESLEKNKLLRNKLKYMDSIKPKLDIYLEALETMKRFIESSCYVTTFLKKENISREEFDNYLDTIRILSPDLYIEVRELISKKHKQKFVATSAMISEIAEEIIQCNNNNQQYDILEFYRKVPFKHCSESGLFIEKLFDFTKELLPQYSDVLRRYVYSKGLSTRTKLIKLNKNMLSGPDNTIIIGDIKFTEELDLALIDYLQKNGYPVCLQTLKLIRKKYAAGEVKFDDENDKVMQKVPITE